MTTDFRALCAELVDDLELCDWPYKLKETIRADINRARAALADEPAVPEGREPASVTEQPRHSEIRLLYCQTFDLRCDPDSIGPAPVKFARAVLARWGTSNLTEVRSSLGDGEVAELVAWLQEEADDYDCIGCADSAVKCNRAAELLQRQALVPVPVGERLPGPEDCDELGRCWCWTPPVSAAGSGYWWFASVEWSEDTTYWLPAHALPLP